ncbi:MAG: hypothetical protein LBE13_00490 [Bacteroidales bacterium]|jgi:hypothetical protein|nr:hypothetical protein [Bacteroidales bacterium]
MNVQAKIEEQAKNNLVTMVLLPQAVWEETAEKINKLLQLIDDGQSQRNTTQHQRNTTQQARIPLIQFKDDKELQHRYGLTYTVVRKIANDNLLRSYSDPGYQRYKWTTHEDIMDYLNQIKTAGIKQ